MWSCGACVIDWARCVWWWGRVVEDAVNITEEIFEQIFWVRARMWFWCCWVTNTHCVWAELGDMDFTKTCCDFGRFSCVWINECFSGLDCLLGLLEWSVWIPDLMTVIRCILCTGISNESFVLSQSNDYLIYLGGDAQFLSYLLVMWIKRYVRFNHRTFKE